MKKQFNVLKTMVFFYLLLATVIVACKEDDEIDVTAPAYLISESEKLTIPAEIDLPSNAPNGNTRVVTYYAKGVQKYKAQQKAGSDPATFEWVFVEPLASLYDVSNKVVGGHAIGPLWNEGKGVIFGQAFSPAKTAKSNDANSIDWLLLMPKAGTTPSGVYADVDYIQRIATTGGKAPATLPTSATQTIDVEYTAIYRFTKINQ